MKELEKFLSYEILGNSILNIVFAITIFIGIYFLIYLFKNYAATRLRNLFENTKTKINYILFDTFIMFINITGIFAAFIIAIKFLKLPEIILQLMNKIIIIFGTIIFTWIIQVGVTKILNEHFNKITNSVKKSFLPFFQNVFNVFLWSISIIFILSNLGYDISSLAAGLGIGGIAIALAIKPTFEAFFASVAIFTDKPFIIGDVIRFGSNEGTVMHIGLRTTQIKTISGTLLIVPNTQLIVDEIENITKREGQRIDAKIGVVYDTSNKKLEDGIKIIRDILSSKKEILDDIQVWFSEFGSSSLIISIIYFIDATLSSNDRMQVITDVNIEIKNEFEKKDIIMAFPTQIVYVKK